MLISIIILNWNRFSDTKACLDSINELEVPTEIHINTIVVDNGSTDGSYEKFESLKSNKFVIIETGKNLGYSSGNNIGIKRALEDNPDWVVVVNNDITVGKKLLVNFLKTVKEKDVGIVSPKIYFSKGYEFHKDRYSGEDLGKVIWYAGGKMDWENVFGVNIGVDEVDRGQFRKKTNIDFATGACIFVKRQVIESIGLYNESYFMYFEDVEFSTRALIAGYKILFCPEMVVWHKVAQGSSIGGNLNDYFITRNRLRFGLKYAKFKTKIALLKESLRLLLTGRNWQKKGVCDFYICRFGKGSWK